MTIYEALNWIKEADYTPCGYLIFNQNRPEGEMKGKALKTIFEAAKRCGASCDDFCGMLKAGWNNDDSFAERKFEEIFGDLLDK